MSPTLCRPQDIAQNVLETAPTLMQLINGEHGKLPGSSPEARVLAILQANPRVSLSSLANQLRISKAHASVMVERLVQRRLVERVTDRTDSRRIVLTISQSGAELLNRWRESSVSQVAEVLARMPEDKLRALHEGIDLLRTALS